MMAMKYRTKEGAIDLNLLEEQAALAWEMGEDVVVFMTSDQWKLLISNPTVSKMLAEEDDP